MEMKDKAKVADAVGGIGGVVGSIGAVSAVGSVAGLSAAGVTSGLATIGGGMVVGLAITAAAPLAIGAGAYGIYKWLKS